MVADMKEKAIFCEANWPTIHTARIKKTNLSLHKQLIDYLDAKLYESSREKTRGDLVATFCVFGRAIRILATVLLILRVSNPFNEALQHSNDRRYIGIGFKNRI